MGIFQLHGHVIGVHRLQWTAALGQKESKNQEHLCRHCRRRLCRRLRRSHRRLRRSRRRSRCLQRRPRHQRCRSRPDEQLV